MRALYDKSTIDPIDAFVESDAGNDAALSLGVLL
jgi:hypothetical protein